MRLATVLLYLLVLPLIMHSQRYAYKITNQGTTDKIVDLTSFDFFSEQRHLIDFINQKYHDEKYGEDYQRAWHFLIDYTWSSGLPLPDNIWKGNITLFLNSFGWGFCDTKAKILAKIWSDMGYESRVWNLEGHFVPEVLVNNKWLVFDPTYHVFYSIPSYGIAGVEELSAYTKSFDCIIDNDSPQNIWTKMMGGGKKTARYYRTTENNSICEVPSKTVVLPWFLFPANASLTFPIYPGFPLITENKEGSSVLKNYAALKLHIPSTWTGEFSLPLVCFALKAENASLEMNDKMYIFEKEALKTINHFNADNIFKINSNTSGIDLYFLINPLLFVHKLGNDPKPINFTDNNLVCEIVSLPISQRHQLLFLVDLNKRGLLRKIGLNLIYKTLKY
ncbi:MAG: hypothetical protein PHT69_05965 [Bacteroidales bacterium]|nr:hypothetical protein [Bacteroidales bacterium]